MLTPASEDFALRRVEQAHVGAGKQGLNVGQDEHALGLAPLQAPHAEDGACVDGRRRLRRLSAAAALASTSAAFCCVVWSMAVMASPTCCTPVLSSALAEVVSATMSLTRWTAQDVGLERDASDDAARAAR